MVADGIGDVFADVAAAVLAVPYGGGGTGDVGAGECAVNHGGSFVDRVLAFDADRLRLFAVAGCAAAVADHPRCVHALIEGGVDDVGAPVGAGQLADHDAAQCGVGVVVHGVGCLVRVVPFADVRGDVGGGGVWRHRGGVGHAAHRRAQDHVGGEGVGCVVHGDLRVSRRDADTGIVPHVGARCKCVYQMTHGAWG